MARPYHQWWRSALTWLSERDRLRVALHTATPGWLRVAAAWLRRYLWYRFRPRHPFVEHAGSGTFPLGPGPVRVALAGDWGGGPGTPAADVAAGMLRGDPHFTIHLGDVYHVGARHEVRRNCLGEDGGVVWPHGSRGSLALPGNHEYHSGGHGYYEVWLPTLGVRPPGGGPPGGQRASYFALEDEHWRVVGLDTGRLAVHPPVVEFLYRALSKLPALAWMRTRLPHPVVRWLRELRLGDDRRGVVLLSHHQVVTAFDRRGGNPFPARQVSGIVSGRRRVLWFWGHEHRLATYEPFAVGSLEVLGRAVGTGSDADVVWKPERYARRVRRAGLAFGDNRLNDGLGHAGWVTLTFDGPALVVTYWSLQPDADPEPFLAETFRVGDGGDVELVEVERLFEALPAAGEVLTPEWVAGL